MFKTSDLSRAALLAASFALTACGSAASDDIATEEVATSELSYDAIKTPTLHGELALGEESAGMLTNEERFHAFDFALTARSDVRIYTLPSPDRFAAVDTMIYLYKVGPRGYGSAITSSDDARKTVWSEVARKLDAGSYRVIVKGKNTGVRGAFRVGFDCPQCLGNAACVLGTTFGEVRRGLTVKVDRERLVNDVSQLTAVEQLQLVDALHASSHTDVTTPEEALARVDANEVNVLHLWDASNARELVAFEYGAGDNSYGRIFPPGSTSPVASIHDGDIMNCNLPKGLGGRDCRASSECGPSFECGGTSPVSGKGKCVPTQSPAGAGNTCTAEFSGQCNTGLICGGLTKGYGLCQPAWVKGSFSEWYGASIPDNRPAGVSRVLDVYGLATVDVDVELDAIIRHPSTSQLRVTLTNPAGTEATVFDGSTNGRDLHIAKPILGFSGDESINGAWTLKVVDAQRGTTGTVERWSLQLTSRMD